MAIVFTTREYLRDHGRLPRGRGYWGFEFEGRDFWATGTLTEAKAACVRHIREIAPKGYDKVVYVNVLP